MESILFDEGKFKTAFHELEFEQIKLKKILPELTFQFNEDKYPQIREKIEQRGWQRLTNPEARINANLIKEFYANAVRYDKADESYTSFVRGKIVDFGPMSVMKALKLRSIPFEEESYHSRLDNNPNYDQIVQDICVPGAD